MAGAGDADNRVMAKLPAEYSRTNLSSDPIYRYLRITKGGPGGVPGMSAEQDLVDSAWLQRLRRIHQLQSAWWVFATAEHSRFQHALGAMHLAGEWARHLYPSLAECCSGTPSAALVEETMRMAGLLHDVGHGPFGHFFDENYLDTWGIDHEVIGRALITGPLAELVAGLGASPNADFEPRERIDPRWVACPSTHMRLKRSTCSSTRGSTSITRSTSTAPFAASICSCARSSARRSSW